MNPFFVLRNCPFLCFKTREAILRSSEWVNFQKYLNFSISNLDFNGSTPEKRRIIVGEVDFGQPINVFNACVCRCSSFSSKTVGLFKFFGVSIDDLK